MIRKVLRADGSGSAGSYLGWKSRRSCVGMGGNYVMIAFEFITLNNKKIRMLKTVVPGS